VSGVSLILGERPLPHALRDISRYCGFSVGERPPEVWAYAYFDILPASDPDAVTAVDVLSTAALHPGLSKANLEFFVEQRDPLTTWLRGVEDKDLSDADCDAMCRLDEVQSLIAPGKTELALLSKVLHRKRPRLVPMFDRRIVDWYRPVLGVAGGKAWPLLTRRLRTDLASQRNIGGFTDIRASLAGELPIVPSNLRLADIAIWMASSHSPNRGHS